MDVQLSMGFTDPMSPGTPIGVERKQDESLPRTERTGLTAAILPLLPDSPRCGDQAMEIAKVSPVFRS